MTNTMPERFDEKFGGQKFVYANEDSIKSFIQSEIDLAVAEREKEIVKIIIKSRTVNEQFGVGLNEETARNQILSDIIKTK